MDKIIRATIQVEVPYNSELLNYVEKLNKKILSVIEDGKFCSSIEAGYLKPTRLPNNRLNDKK
jgi:hypothetical protein